MDHHFLINYDSLANEYPVYTGRHFMCSYCQMMFISEDFLNKHQTKCAQMKLHLIVKFSLQKIKRKKSNKGDKLKKKVKNPRALREARGKHAGSKATNPGLSNDFGDSTENIGKRKSSDGHFCETCVRAFVKMSDYLKHMRQDHSSEGRFQCDQCDRSFIYKCYLQRHVSAVHNKQRPFKCELCPKSFRDKYGLVIHVRNHTGERPYTCPHCPMAFIERKILNEHLLMHSGAPSPFICPEPECGKSFALKCALTKHSRVHSGERPYECIHCPMTFAHRINLTRHIRTHTGERPFECTECPSTFAIKEHLKIHMRSHTGEKPYECVFCKRGFSNKAHLNRHIKIHIRQFDNIPKPDPIM